MAARERCGQRGREPGSGHRAGNHAARAKGNRMRTCRYRPAWAGNRAVRAKGNSMIIRRGNLHIGDGRVLPQWDLRLEGSRIAEIGQNLSAGGEEEIDAAGCEVFPGFIDPCCSIGCMGLPTTYRDNNEVSAPLVPEMNLKYSFDPDELTRQEFWRSGITAVGLTASNGAVLGGQTVAVKTPPMRMKDRIIRERVFLKGCVTDGPRDTFGGSSKCPMTRMGIFGLLEKIFSETEQKEPEKRNEKERVIAQVIAGELPLVLSAEKKSEIQAALHFAGERHLKIHIVDGYEFDRCLPEMKASGAGLIVGNLSSFSQKSKHHMNLSALSELLSAGCPAAFTTSCGGFSDGREVFLWDAIDAYRAGVDAEDIVRMMTFGAARILGVDDRIGTLETGKDADIVIYTAHPVKTYQARVRTCLVNGEVIYHE